MRVSASSHRIRFSSSTRCSAPEKSLIESFFLGLEAFCSFLFFFFFFFFSHVLLATPLYSTTYTFFFCFFSILECCLNCHNFSCPLSSFSPAFARSLLRPRPPFLRAAFPLFCWDGNIDWFSWTHPRSFFPLNPPSRGYVRDFKDGLSLSCLVDKCGFRHVNL